MKWDELLGSTLHAVEDYDGDDYDFGEKLTLRQQEGDHIREFVVVISASPGPSYNARLVGSTWASASEDER